MNSNLQTGMGDFPIGTIIPFGGTINSESFEQQGWLYCNGNAINRKSFSDLFNIIGTNFGEGDGSSTFNLPDFRGMFLRGVSGESGNDPDANSRQAPTKGGSSGNNIGSIQEYATGQPKTSLTSNETGAHTHTANHIPTDNSSYAIAGSYQAIWNGGSSKTDLAGNHKHSIIGGGDSESRPINANVFFLIKHTNI